MVFEVGAHALPQEHRVVALEDPFTGAMPQRARRLVGFELVRDPRTKERFPAELNLGQRIRNAATARGLLSRASHWMLALAPPLTTTEAEMDEMLDRLGAAVEEVLGATETRRLVAA